MKMKSMIGLFAILAAAMTASAVTLRFIPGNAPTPYDWNSPALWVNSSTGASANRLPGSSDDVSIIDAHTRENPLFVNAGTDAIGYRLYLSTTNATLTAPMLLTIDGGSLSFGNLAYIGYKAPAILTVQNGGSFSAGGVVELGSVNTTSVGPKTFDAKVIVADATSSFTVGDNFFMGTQWKGLSLFENHGLTTFKRVYVGYYKRGARELGEIVSVIDNYGTITQLADYKFYIGASSGQTGIVTNHAGAAINTLDAFCVGSSSNSVGRLVNEGTVNVAQLNVGGNLHADFARNSDPNSISKGYIENSGTIVSSTGFIRIGHMTNCFGRVDNTGVITGANECVLGYFPGSKGYLRHSDGNLVFTNTSKSVHVGYQGSGYLELAGNTKTVFDKVNALTLANNAGNESGTYHSSGELVITNSASLSRGGRNLSAGRYKYSTARIALYDDATLSDIGTLWFGNVKTDSTFEMHDNAVLSNVSNLILNVGSSANDATGVTRMKLSGNARVCGVTNITIGAGIRNNVELEIADNAFFGLSDDAKNSNGTTNMPSILVAVDPARMGNATIRLRGGTIGLGISGTLFLSDNANGPNVGGCPAKLIGYGCITNQGSHLGYAWSRINLRNGSVTADGEGENKDLDLSFLARISGHASDGRKINLSGTNGWYAINKGRLRYPNRDSELVRFVGDYSRLEASYDPIYVNSMRILIKDKNGDEITSNRKYTVYLYAPDRADIRAGLVGDDARNRRLGVWRGHSSVSFAKAETTIRYDQWRLAELKDGNGNYPPNLEVCLYKCEDVDGSKWKRVASYPASEAEARGYLIGGGIEKSGGNNLGWFAVVAKEGKGTSLIIR